MENKKKRRIKIEFKTPVIEVVTEEILERKVSQLGNSGHISVPRKQIGKTATVIIKTIVKNGK